LNRSFNRLKKSSKSLKFPGPCGRLGGLSQCIFPPEDKWQHQLGCGCVPPEPFPVPAEGRPASTFQVRTSRLGKRAHTFSMSFHWTTRAW